MGALETKKLLMFSGWKMERCELFAIENCDSDMQLEAPLSRQAEIRARVKARQTDLLSKTTG